ncbi:hypothetical protein Trydic_g18792 [Trypoxylus dichotomus]
MTNASSACLCHFADFCHLLVDCTVEYTIFLQNGQPDVLDVVDMRNAIPLYHSPPVYENADVNRIERVHRRVREILTQKDNEDSLRPTSAEEVKVIIKSFRPDKALGPDGIIYRDLEYASRKFVMQMTKICNAMLRLRYSPSLWKQADVAMMPKSGQLTAELPAHQSPPGHE